MVFFILHTVFEGGDQKRENVLCVSDRLLILFEKDVEKTAEL